MQLAQYFKAPYYAFALDHYALLAADRCWSLRGKLSLYRSASIAFDSDADEARKLAQFRVVYDSLRSNWQVFRNAAGPCWDYAEAYEMLSTSLGACSRRSCINLTTLADCAEYADEILDGLRKLEDIKPVRSFPHMAVAKFTHFFNPRLFPIYDNEVIWRQVCRVFKDDYRETCRRIGIAYDDDSASFNLAYTLWASENISQADPSLMPWFRDWLYSYLPAERRCGFLHGALTSYYATAFEYVAIGAALIESHRDNRLLQSKKDIGDRLLN